MVWMFGLARDPANLLKVDLFWNVIEMYNNNDPFLETAPFSRVFVRCRAVAVARGSKLKAELGVPGIAAKVTEICADLTPDQASGERRLDFMARLLSTVDLTCYMFVFNILPNPLGPVRDRFHG